MAIDKLHLVETVNIIALELGNLCFWLFVGHAQRTARCATMMATRLMITLITFGGILMQLICVIALNITLFKRRSPLIL